MTSVLNATTSSLLGPMTGCGISTPTTSATSISLALYPITCTLIPSSCSSKHHYYRNANSLADANRPAGFCFTGTVPPFGPWPELDFTYCAKDPGVPYPTFVAITNAICQAEFSGIVAHDDTYWACPAYLGGTWAGMIYGGDNFDNIFDASNWQLQAI